MYVLLYVFKGSGCMPWSLERSAPSMSQESYKAGDLLCTRLRGRPIRTLHQIMLKCIQSSYILSSL